MAMNKKRKGRRTHGQMEQTAKLDSASEITSQHDAVQCNLKGSCTANESRGSTASLNVSRATLDFSEQKTTLTD